MNAIYCDLPCCQQYGIYEFSLLKYSLKYRSMIYPYQKLIPLEFENDIDNNKYLFENYNTLGPLHSMLCEGLEFTSKNQFPVVEPYTGELPDNLCSIHRLRKKPDSLLRVICAHFFTDDSNFRGSGGLFLRIYLFIRICFSCRCCGTLFVTSSCQHSINGMEYGLSLHRHGVTFLISNYSWKVGQKAV